MVRNRFTNLMVLLAVLVMLVLLGALGSAYASGFITRDDPLRYVDSLFATDIVHTIDIRVDEDDWQEMLDNAQNEEYILVDVVVDGSKVGGVGIRPKGNSSLSSIANSDSERYSFKLEFDHYVDGRSYLGLDKLVLNNIAQDNTYLKDYLSYHLMNEMGAWAPLSSYIWVTVNGEDWGLYLAVESVEESFTQRVSDSLSGTLYKPDTMDMAGGMGGFGGGMGAAGVEGVEGAEGAAGVEGTFAGDAIFPEGDALPEDGASRGGGFMPGGRGLPEETTMPEGGAALPEGMTPPEGGEMPEGMTPPGDGEMPDFENMPQGAFPLPEGDPVDIGAGEFPGGGMAGGMAGGSSATSLIYTDDDPDSYAAIFDSAKSTISAADKSRFIEALRRLNAQEDIAETVNVDEVISYFAVHDFVLNSDSYTGSLTHNYYLYEDDGQLSMIAWDYNLAFGGMGGMGGMGGFAQGNTATSTLDTATTLVNYPIDSPMLSGEIEDKPMIAWIFSDEHYLAAYHDELGILVEYLESAEFATFYADTLALIAPYVQRDPTAFCTYEAFETASTALHEFCLLRAESIKGQLAGTIPATSEAQAADGASLIDASSIDIESMGSSTLGFNRARPNQDASLGFGPGAVADTGEDALSDVAPDALQDEDAAIP
ncbi:MAG: CotH kinase family protein [Coriobacteriales bacterium]|jgi:hypothetical protein|nr:CotH kinase family protein [Coriobacteriales bacterium]